jgi:succinyl-CoA synthetase alpha subunit
MKVAQTINKRTGVIDSAVIMGTAENQALLDSAGLLIPEFASADDTDLLIAVKADNVDNADGALAEAEEQLLKLSEKGERSSSFKPGSIEGAVEFLNGANLAIISIAGKYAGTEARKALMQELHVMLFSDNVSLEEEIGLKRFAQQRGLLLMGPDCGTAIINGIPLAFANNVVRGVIGIVAAAGTGLQEVSCLISRAGAGISQAIGTGGRDLSKEVGGLMFIQGLEALAEDPDTSVILLVSKCPHPDTLEKIISVVKNIAKPVVSIFLGADTIALGKQGWIPTGTLEEAALVAAALARGDGVESVSKWLGTQDAELHNIAKQEALKLASSQKYLRALFSGGTFCSEAQILCNDILQPVYSNTPSGNSVPLADSFVSEKHTIVDLGEDEFTVGRLHPMIDYSLRNRRIISEAQDPGTGVILLDVVLGYGANPEPLPEIVPILEEAQKIAVKAGRHLPVVCSVTGTDKDPQNRTIVVDSLKKAGVLVMESNAAACKLATYILEDSNEK